MRTSSGLLVSLFLLAEFSFAPNKLKDAANKLIAQFKQKSCVSLLRERFPDDPAKIHDSCCMQAAGNRVQALVLATNGNCAERKCDNGNQCTSPDYICCKKAVTRNHFEATCKLWWYRPSFNKMGNPCDEGETRLSAGDVQPDNYPYWLWKKHDVIAAGLSAGYQGDPRYWTIGALLRKTGSPGDQYFITNAHNFGHHPVIGKRVQQPSSASMDDKDQGRMIGTNTHLYYDGQFMDAAFVQLDRGVDTACALITDDGESTPIDGSLDVTTLSAGDELVFVGRSSGLMTLSVDNVGGRVPVYDTPCPNGVVLTGLKDKTSANAFATGGNSGSVGFKLVNDKYKAVCLFNGDLCCNSIQWYLRKQLDDHGLSLEVCKSSDHESPVARAASPAPPAPMTAPTACELAIMEMGIAADLAKRCCTAAHQNAESAANLAFSGEAACPKARALRPSVCAQTLVDIGLPLERATSLCAKHHENAQSALNEAFN